MNGVERSHRLDVIGCLSRDVRNKPIFIYTAGNKNCLSMNHLYTLLGCNWMFGDLFLKQRSFFRAYLVTILKALVWSNSAKCSKCFPPSIFIHTYSGKWQSLAFIRNYRWYCFDRKIQNHLNVYFLTNMWSLNKTHKWNFFYMKATWFRANTIIQLLNQEGHNSAKGFM